MRFSSACAAILLACASAGTGTATASAQSVDELVAKYYEARGGYDKIKAIQTLKITRTVGTPFAKVQVVIYKKRPNLLRIEQTPPGAPAPIARAVNATGGWDTQAGKIVPRLELMANEDREIEGDIDGLLVDWKAKGHTVVLDGQENILGRPAHALAVTTKGGVIRYVFLDTKTFLEVAQSGRMSLPPDPKTGKPRFNEHVFTYSDFRDVNGVKFPFAVDEERTGGPITQSFAVYTEKIEANVPLDDALFAAPSPGSGIKD